MHRFAALATLILTTPALANPADAMFDWVTITDAGNAGYDRPTINSFLPGRGSVAYDYRIAREEVSTEQYLTFINTFTTQSDALAARITEPTRWGAERDFSYAGPSVRYKLRTDVTDAGRLPTLGVNWRGAAHFINWMNNGLSSDPAAIEDGAYDASTFTGDSQTGFNDQSTRHANAEYFLPTYDEWIKAAHYDPDKNGPGQGGWWIYNDGSDTQPVPGPPGEGETSVFWVIDGVDGRPAWNTPLGSYPQTMSPWGLIDVSGGGGEWTESWQPGASANRYRLWQGGVAGTFTMTDTLDYPAASTPGFPNSFTSFRIAATVPAPIAPGVLLAPLFLHARRRRPATSPDSVVKTPPAGRK